MPHLQMGLTVLVAQARADIAQSRESSRDMPEGLPVGQYKAISDQSLHAS